jgi:prolyl oligopeptidase
MNQKSQFITAALITTTMTLNTQTDKYLYLEEVDGLRALEFVEAQNKATVAELSAQKDYQSIYDMSLEISNSTEQIAYPAIRGNYVYNFWKDKDHVRGIWRRCSVESYKMHKPIWETLLDIDELSEKENIKWVFKGSSGLYPDYNRFLVQLSNGGGDAVVTKEFDATKKAFIEEGFYIAESKGSASYVDENTLVVCTNFGAGTMTTSGYPRQVKLWKRGTAISTAQLIHEGNSADVGNWGSVMHDGAKAYTWVTQSSTFYTRQSYVMVNGKAIKLDLPEDASTSGILNNLLLVELKSDWTLEGKTYKTGSLLSMNFTELLKGKKIIQVLLVPDDFSSISQVSTTKNKVLVSMLSNVISQLHMYTVVNGKWTSQKVKAPDYGRISIVGADDLSDQYYFSFQNFITPATLYAADASKNTFEAYQSLPAFFDASKYEIKQYKAKSEDGTMVPYFMVASKNLKLDGTNPTLVYAYGGFEVSTQPFYSAGYGVSWLDRGGVLVVANIRGGGEFGPKWHQAGLKDKRQNVFNDLYAVTGDLISKKVSTPRHLGVMGGSNGGLLVGVAFTQRPDLYNAVVCQVPLLDMQRYNKLLAGASWMGEYGNPDIEEEWAYIKKYSPYHNLKEGTAYPEVFFGTSTRDDRVHPGHARKMAAKMNDMGYKTYYYENTEGGHAGSSTNEQSAKSSALTFSYLLMKLK